MFERWWRVPVEVVLLLFGLVNAGIPLHGLEAGSLGIPLAAIGRPIGIVAAAGIAIAAGLHFPQRVGWREVVVVGCTASIGLVFALFFAAATVAPGPMLSELKMGALLTILGGLLAFGAAMLLRVGRFEKRT